MIVRYEKSKEESILIIDECNKYLGECYIDPFVDAIEERDTFEEDGYEFFFVNREKLNLAFKSFSRQK